MSNQIFQLISFILARVILLLRTNIVKTMVAKKIHNNSYYFFYVLKLWWFCSNFHFFNWWILSSECSFWWLLGCQRTENQKGEKNIDIFIRLFRCEQFEVEQISMHALLRIGHNNISSKLCLVNVLECSGSPNAKPATQQSFMLEIFS